MQLTSLVLVAALSAVPIETKFAQVAPAPQEATESTASASNLHRRTSTRAVVLIHGLKIHPLSSHKAQIADFHEWQKPDSDLVSKLSPHADIYALAYSQNAPVDVIAAAPALRKQVRRLQARGYQQIVMIGHSAGGLIARQFVEDQPRAGVTKVIQVGSPNAGSCWAHATIGVREPQEAFLTSLTSDARTKRCEESGKVIPDGVEFVCLVGDLEPYSIGTPAWLESWVPLGFRVCADPFGDGLVSADSQWPADLREQGVPMMRVDADHCEMMHCEQTISTINHVVRSSQPRWDAQRLASSQEALGEADRFRVEFGSRAASSK
jgi:pimeloyl-ACP methyl ester carboxylesterase